eukprot:TRINITY_DN17180_c0_g3_i3.p1 TRINITY_DN17180_c0_g3~~TRINITY_DN17180_c0_g3_i3.p1  ORF type:complete len:379 (+),score=10.56 TRINITY_DN17180_c0_g3_i3:53-1189(+)
MQLDTHYSPVVNTRPHYGHDKTLETVTVQTRLAHEIQRKLKLAYAADTQESRDIVCSEIFTDVTGALDEGVRDVLDIQNEQWFYEFLAPFYEKFCDVSEALVFTCQKMWGQPYVPPIFCLLLYRWLFLQKNVAKKRDRQTLMNVMLQGCRHLFQGDMYSSQFRFQTLYDFLLNLLVDGRCLEQCFMSLPSAVQVSMIQLLCAYYPYYRSWRELGELGHYFSSFQLVDVQDILTDELIHMLRKMKSEHSTLKYLQFLDLSRDLPFVKQMRTVAKIRLQNELYSLARGRAPRHPPISIQRKAERVLNALFPMGQRMRWIVSGLFRIFYPQDTIGVIVDFVVFVWVFLLGILSRVAGVFFRIFSPFQWRRTRRVKLNDKQE